jgi:RNA polymerase sigma-70 factor (ECF subfamily)
MNEPIDRLYERVLVVRCQAGDERAFGELVGRYHARLRAYVTRMLGDAHLAEDALQETWLDVFRSAPRLRDAGAFRGWLYRLARDRVYRVLRGLGRATEPLDEQVAAEEEVAVVEPELVHEALDHLAPAHREVLWLRYVEQMSYEQVAGVVGCAVGTVRSRIHYAKRALRRAIERSGRDE